MNNPQHAIQLTFDNLLADSGALGQRVRSRIDHGSPVNIYAARVFPRNNVLLEIGPIKKAYIPLGFIRPRIRGLSISIDSQRQSAGGDITLLLELQQTEAIDVFVIFVSRVCEEMERLEKPADAVRALIAQVEHWKEFFAGNTELLSEDRQTGLYGELHLMSRLFDAGLPIDQLVSAWTGSKRTNQDYEFGDVSIEVKSTAAVDATSVSITNIRQLDKTGLELLLLTRVLLDARQGNEHTLPVLINSLRAAIAERAPELVLEFEEKILQVKYRNDHAEHYTNRTYAEHALEFYEVREGFPRLLESGLPIGVTKASYEITLETCKPFEQPSDVVFEKMRKYCV